MARFRDTQILKKITNPEFSIEHEAQLFLFLMVEQKLRVIIYEAQKYQYHFKKPTLSRQEIELAIKDQNQSNTQIMGFNYIDTVTMSKKRDTFVLNDQNCDLKDLICQEMRQITIPINYPILQLHYVLKDGKMVNIPETQSILRLDDIVAKEIKEDEEQQKQFAMVKDNIYQILSPHQQDYLKQFMKLFNQNIYQHNEEFQQLITQIKQYQDIAGILPFLIKFFYSFCESSGVFSYKTKSTLIECIQNLLLNKFVNLDFHLHVVIKMLLLLLTSQINSGSISKDFRFYNKVAELLKIITKKYSSKYLLLDVNFAQTMYKILEEQFNEIQQDTTQSKYYNMLICNAIVEYFQDSPDLQEIKYLSRMIKITSSILNQIDENDQNQCQKPKMDVEDQSDVNKQQMETKYIYCKLQLQLEVTYSSQNRYLQQNSSSRISLGNFKRLPIIGKRGRIHITSSLAQQHFPFRIIYSYLKQYIIINCYNGTRHIKLSNYSKVLEMWQNYSGEDDEYFNFVVARALMAQRELRPNSSIQIQKKPSQQLLEITELVSKFMSPLLKPGRSDSTVDQDRSMIEDALKKIKVSFDDNTKYSRLLKIICGYLSINACEAQYALALDSSQKDAASAEIKFLQLLCLLRGRRPDLADKKLYELKKFDDEDVLTYLGNIYTYIYNGQPVESLRAINEAKDRFGESAKLMNLMVSALISQNKFDEAFQLASLLQQALLEKEQFSDRVEIETCLSNLIILAEICGKPSVRDECTQALQTINQGSMLIKIHQQKLTQLQTEFQ